MNFVLYLGPISFAAMLLLCGLIVFDGAMSFLPALTYMLMNMTEGQFVTPSLIGKQMSVNPLRVFTSLVFWLWLWGPLGGVIAIPMLVWFRQVTKAMQAGVQSNSTDMQTARHRKESPETQTEVAHAPAE